MLSAIPADGPAGDWEPLDTAWLADGRLDVGLTGNSLALISPKPSLLPALSRGK